MVKQMGLRLKKNLYIGLHNLFVDDQVVVTGIEDANSIERFFWKKNI